MIPDEDGSEIALEMTFENNGACVVKIVAVEEMKEGDMKMNIGVEVDVHGTYKLNSKDLKIDLAKEKAKVDIDIDIEGVDDQTKAMMTSMINPELEKGKDEAKKELLKVLPDLDNATVVSLENHRLVLAGQSGKELTFYAK